MRKYYLIIVVLSLCIITRLFPISTSPEMKTKKITAGNIAIQNNSVFSTSGSIILSPYDGTLQVNTFMTVSGNTSINGWVSASNLAINNWNTAYSWGNHATSGYASISQLAGYMSTSHIANTITSANIANWNTTYANEVLVAQLGTPSQTSVEQINNGTLSAGRISGGTITSNGDGTIKVDSGTGLIRSTNSDTSTLYSFNWQTNAVVGVTNNSASYITIRYNGGSPFATSTTDLSTVDLNTEFIIGYVYRSNNDVEITMNGSYLPNYVTNNNARLLYRGIERMTGTAIAEKATRYVTSTAGVWYFGNTKVSIPSADSSIQGFKRVYWLTSAGKYTFSTSQTQIDNTQYNNGTTLVSLTGTNHTVRWVYICLDGGMYYIYDTLNSTLANAQAATPPAIIPDYLEKNSLLVGKIIIQRNGSTFISIQSAFTNQFTPVNVNNHNDLANLQGGDGTSYYHLGSANYSALNTIPLGSMLWASSANYLGQIAPNASATTLYLTQSSSGLPSWQSSLANAAGATNQIQFNNGGTLGANANFVYNGTNLGIGTTSPVYTLDVNGTINAAGPVIYDGGGGYTARTNLQGALNISLIAGGGTVAITRYSLYNGANWTNGGLADRGFARTRWDATGNWSVDTVPAQTSSTFAEGTWSSKLYLQNTGNVGIGTSAPSEKLEVVGNIKASGWLTATGATTAWNTTNAITVNGNATVTGFVTASYGQFQSVSIADDVYVFVSESANTTPTAGSWQTINLARVVSDSRGAWNTASHTFTAPQTGIYDINETANLKSTTASTEISVGISINGGAVYYLSSIAAIPANTPSSRLQGKTILALNKNDTIVFGIYCASATCTLGGDATAYYSYAQIKLMR